MLQPTFIAGKAVLRTAAIGRTAEPDLPLVQMWIIDEVVAEDEPISLRFILDSQELGLNVVASAPPASQQSRYDLVNGIYGEIEKHWVENGDSYPAFMRRLQSYDDLAPIVKLF